MNRFNRLPTLFALFLSSSSLALIACGGGNDNLPPAPPPPPAPVETVEVTKPVVEAKKPEPPAPPPITLKAGEASPDPSAPLPTVKITAPSKDQVIPVATAKDFAIKLDVKNWQTATGSQHVHLILDNKPYKAIYDTKVPVKMTDLLAGEALSEGQHVLVAFPSRPSHESVKSKGAFTTVQFYVGKKAPDTTDLKKPMLVYSRPKGDYKGEMANHVLVDFQVANVTLAEGKEHVTVNVQGPGIEGALNASVSTIGTPLYLDNLVNGLYTLKLELVGADGKVLAGPWNSTTRQIRIDRDAPADPMPHPMGDMKHEAADAGAAKAPVVAPKATATTPKAPAPNPAPGPNAPKVAPKAAPKAP
ncbi:MAG: hypothetical protein KBF88_16105 [Polyangiaceae bacterium]|nr:hypothetical protein [Polyangiaceae bacterium]